jgi:hypothetical protein
MSRQSRSYLQCRDCNCSPRVGQILSNAVMQTIRADISLCERLMALTSAKTPILFQVLLSKAFHDIPDLKAHLKIHSSIKALSFLLRCSASQPYPFREIAFSSIWADVRTFLNIENSLQSLLI